MKKPKFKVLKPDEPVPGLGGVSIYRPEFRTMKPAEIIKQSNLQELIEYGYNLFILNRQTGTVHIYH